MYDGGWAATGEIDVMEAFKDTDTWHGTLHFGGSWPDNEMATEEIDGCGADPCRDTYHEWAIEWRSDSFTWFVDGVEVSKKESSEWWTTAVDKTVDPSAPFDQPFHVLINFAVGGTFAGQPDVDAVFPQILLVDYVAVYSEAS